MKKMLTENLGIKLTAVLLAILFWLIVVNVDNPSRTEQFRVPVTLKNADTVTDAGMVYEILDDTDSVTVTVRAPRSVVTDMEASDLTVTADFDNITPMNTIPLEVTANRYANRIDRMVISHYNLKVDLEEAKTREFPVSLEIQGTPAEGYTVGDISATPNLVTVTGPAGVVDRIQKLTARVSVENRKMTTRTSVDLKPEGADGAEIRDDRLTLSQKQVMTSVSFLQTKSVDLRLSTTGTCASGYHLADIESDPTTVTIAGAEAVLNEISTIQIPGGVLNIQNATEDVVKEIDISQYLPQNVKIPQGGNTSVKLTARIQQLEEQQFIVPTSAINLMNTPENTRANFGDLENIIIVLTGKPEDLQQVTGDDFSVSVDLAGLSEGTHRVYVTVVTPENISVSQDTWVDVTLESTLPPEVMEP